MSRTKVYNTNTQTWVYADKSFGKDGTSVTVKSVVESAEDGGVNVVTFSDGTSLNVKNGSKGSTGATPVKGIDYWTDADQESIIQQVIVALGTPVFGTMDADNNIILTGELADGTYTLKYEDVDGNVTNIGMITIGGVSYTNQIPIATDSSGNIYGEDYNSDGVNDGYKIGVRVSSGAEQTADGIFTTGYIPVNEGDVVYLKNVTMPQNGTNYNCRISLFTSLASTDQKNIQASNAAEWVWDSDGNAAQFTVPAGWFSGAKAKFMRLGTAYIGADSIVTINEPIE